MRFESNLCDFCCCSNCECVCGPYEDSEENEDFLRERRPKLINKYLGGESEDGS